MDRLIFTALNTIQFAQEDNIIRSNNLANVSVPGYRKDLEPKVVNTGFLDAMEQFDTRAYAIREGRNRFSREPGRLDYTEQPTDVAITGDGFFFIQTPSGEPALSRRGDFRVDTQGQLIDGAGNLVLSANLQPITLPPYRSISIGEHGMISLELVGGEPGEIQETVQIGTTLAEAVELKKHADGHIRMTDGTLPPADQNTRMIQGYLESSNVNSVEELVESMQRQRAYEINIRIISTARELDESGATLMRMPN